MCFRPLSRLVPSLVVAHTGALSVMVGLLVGERANAAEADEKILQAQGIALTAKGIGSFLRAPDSPLISRQEYRDLISDLGEKDFLVREKASRALENSSVVYRDLLEQAIASTDPEVSWRARGILNLIDS